MIKAIIFDCFGVVRTDYFDEVYTAFGGDVAEDAELIRKAFLDSHNGKTDGSGHIFAKRLGITVEE